MIPLTQTAQMPKRFKSIRIRTTSTTDWFYSKLQCRNESTGSTNNSGGHYINNPFSKPKIGGKSGAVWERMAVAVKYSEKETLKNNTYLNTIRATHDPHMELKTVEEELKGTIGKALGRQGHKIMHAKQLMEKELQNYNDLITLHSLSSTTTTEKKNSDNNAHHHLYHPEIIKSAQHYNEYRKQAIQARWELTVQRQAAGLIINNHNYVTEQYPIPDAIPIPEPEGNNNDTSGCNTITTIKNIQEKDRKIQFTDQLQWWERVGRWR